MVSTLICKSAIFLMLTLQAFSASLSAPVEGQQIFLHTEMFEDNYRSVTPKDVGAFKYFCIHDYVSSIVNQYIDIFADEDPFSLENYFNNVTTICKEYAKIKTYQFMLYQSLGHQGATGISNTTILSIVYLLQNARGYLQEINYDNHKAYCPDYDEEIQMVVANQMHTIESVFRTLYDRNENDWSRDGNYPVIFNSSRYIQYRNGTEPLCQHYMSLFMTMIIRN